MIYCISQYGYAQKKNHNTKPYPFGNPIITHMYTADASPHVMPDGRVWMVTSVDLDAGGGYSTMHSYHTFSSSDMVNWVDHGEIFNISDIAPNEDPTKDDYALWAPDIIYRNGKYYLYYPVHIRHRDDLNENGIPKVTSYIGVAVSDAPDKKFRVIKDKIEGTAGIDPSVFLDDDGQLYLYWGQRWVAVLKDNIVELATKPRRMEIGADNFMEGPWIHKRHGKYYFNYHTKYGNKVDPDNPDDPDREKSQLDWSWGTSPLGPLTYGGVLNHELGFGVVEPDAPKYPGKNYVPWRLTQSNHGGVVTYHGQDYLFYHTSALSSWRQDEFKAQGTWTQRSVCVDMIRYDKEGRPLPVQQTLSGVAPVVVKQPYEIKLAPSVGKGRNLVAKGEFVSIDADEATLLFRDVDLGTGYYYFDLKTEKVSKAGKVEIRKNGPKGELVGTLLIDKNSLNLNGGVIDTSLIGAYGKQDLWLIFTGLKGGKLSQMRCFAGAPLPLSSSLTN